MSQESLQTFRIASTLHRSQDSCADMLKGHIEVATDLFFFLHSDQEVFINLGGETIKKTNPLQPFNLSQLMQQRSEEHTSELQSRLHLVCRLLLEKKKKRSIVEIHHEL